jgi:glycine cleavage system H lipoate-binding protein
MNEPKPVKRNLYYTNDHEWIDFQGSVAYVGVCHFKLSGFKEIQQIIFAENSELINQGEVIASVKFDDYLVPVHMPVEGRIISFNDILLTEEKSILLQQPENNGWIALVVPSQLNDMTGLLSLEEYKFLQAKYK